MKKNHSIPVAEREVQVQMEDGLGAVSYTHLDVYKRQSLAIS